jgi:hypothetical protein
MKKKIYCLFAICTIIVSCKKEHINNSNNSNTLHKVIFNIGFSKQITNFQANSLTANAIGKTDAVTNDTALTNHIATLLLAIYNASTGALVKTVAQSSTSNGFGSYIANLPSGSYIIIIAGGGEYLQIANLTNVVVGGGWGTIGNGNINTDILQYYDTDPNALSGSSNYPGKFNQDTFFKKLNLTVSNSDVSESVALDRITSKLEIVIQDALPNNIYSISMSATSGTASQFSLSTGNPLTFGGLNPSFGIPSTLSGMTNYTCSTIFLGEWSTTFNVGITAASRSQTLVYKLISGVTCQPNTITILSGKLFTNSSTSNNGLGVKIDTAWSSNTIVKTFP